MNKKIKTEIALGIIVVVAIVIAGIVWLTTVDRRNQVEMATQQKEIPENYLSYSDEENGIHFVYPRWWGNASFNHHENTPSVGFGEIAAPSFTILLNRHNSEYKCPSNSIDALDFFGKGVSEDTVMDEIVYCKEEQINGQAVVQLYIFEGGDYGTLGDADSYGVYILTRIFSPDGSRYVKLIQDGEALRCRNCGMSYKEFIEQQKTEIKYLVESCVRGKFLEWRDEKTGYLTKKGCLSNSTRLVFELDNFIQSIKIE